MFAAVSVDGGAPGEPPAQPGDPAFYGDVNPHVACADDFEVFYGAPRDFSGHHVYFIDAPAGTWTSTAYVLCVVQPGVGEKPRVGTLENQSSG